MYDESDVGQKKPSSGQSISVISTSWCLGAHLGCIRLFARNSGGAHPSLESMLVSFMFIEICPRSGEQAIICVIEEHYPVKHQRV